ncbi:MAG TPA: hypothetical protein VGN52_10035 [Burkholderiales bacterium]
MKKVIFLPLFISTTPLWLDTIVISRRLNENIKDATTKGREREMNTEIKVHEQMDIAGDMFQTIGLAAAAGLGAAVASGLIVLLIALTAG